MGVGAGEGSEAVPSAVNLELFDALMGMGLRDVDADALIGAEDPERIRKAIEYTRSRQGKVDSPAAYLRTAIKHGYADVQPEEEKPVIAAVGAVGQLSEVSTAARLVADQMAQESLRREYERSLIAMARQEYASLPEDEQAALRSQFGKMLSTARDLQSWERIGITSPPLSARFFGWIAHQGDRWNIDEAQLRLWSEQKTA